MEEKILEIMAQNITHLRMVQACETSVKITSHVMEFVGWLINGDMIWHDGTKGIGWVTVIEIDNKEYTLDEVYQYWLKNVKDGLDTGSEV
jgi:hypothetical protein